MSYSSFPSLNKEMDRHGAFSPWWKPAYKGEKLARALFDFVTAIDEQQDWKYESIFRSLRQYGDFPAMGMGPNTYTIANPQRPRRLRYNVIKSVVDTLTSVLGQERVRPFVATDGAHFHKRQAAQDLTKAVLGVFQAAKVFEQAPDVFRDGALFGLGAWKVGVCHRTKNIEIERVFPGEIYYDDAETLRGKACQLSHKWTVPRSSLLEKYGNIRGAAAAIQKARLPKERKRAGVVFNAVDVVEVVESWHLPSYPGAGDGRWVQCIEDFVIFDKPWEFDFFPLVFFKYSNSVQGFKGSGLGDQLTGFQVSINNDIDRIDRILDLFASPWLLVSQQSRVRTEQFHNKIGRLVRYDEAGSPPQVVSTRGVPPDLQENVLWKIDAAHKLAGLNELTIAGRKPSGIESGRGLRELNDTAAARFMTTQRAWQDCYLELADVVLRLMYANWKNLGKKVKVKGRRFIETIDFDAIDLDEDAFELQVYPTSMLPKEPGARQQRLTEWVTMGWIDQQQAMELAEFPDLEAHIDLATAAQKDIDKTIDHMLFSDPDPGLLEEFLKKRFGSRKPGEDELALAKAELSYRAPEGFQDLQLGIKRCEAHVLLARHSDVPPERVDLLLRWIADAKRDIERSQAPTAPGSQPGVPAGAPGALPAGQPLPIEPQGVF